MTKIDVYVSARDRDIIVNSTWSGKLQYVKLGNRIVCDNNNYISEIWMLNESDVNTWQLKGQISRWQKLKLRVQWLKQIWRFTK